MPLSKSNSRLHARIDPLDKGIDLFQQHVLREGPQTDESEEEKRKDEMISGAVKKGYKGVTGKELFGDGK